MLATLSWQSGLDQSYSTLQKYKFFDFWNILLILILCQIQLVRAEDNEYDVEYENGSVFTIPAKDTYKQNSVSFRKAIHSTRSKSKSRARSKGRAQRTKKKVDLGDESSADESLPVEEPEKKASNSSRFSRKSIVATPVASPKASNSSKVASSPKASNSSKVSGRDTKASNSSRVSSRSKRVSNTSHVSNRATTDAFSEDDDDLGMLSVSARASRSSQIAPENESELELLATDQTQLSEEAEAAPNAASARASISSRISSLIFGTSTPTPAQTDAPDSASLDAVSEDEDAEVSSTRPSASSKKASVSSRISSMLFGGSSSSKPPSTSSKIEEAAENTSAETSSKRASASSGRSTTEEYDTLVLRSRTVTETLSPLSELGQDGDEKEAPAADSSTAPALTEDEEENEAQPVSTRASASSRKASASSKKASVSSRVSFASKKASTSSRRSQKEELVESVEEEEEAPADVTEEVESTDKTSNVDKASISSRISNMLFGGTPKASTSSKVSETNGTQSEKVMEDLASAEVSSFPFISARRSSRASTRASTLASNASVRQSASPNRSGRLDEFSEDEEKEETAPTGETQSTNEEKTEAASGGGQWSVEWLWAIFFMLLCPAILVSLHTICTGHVCNLAVPRLSIDPR